MSTTARSERFTIGIFGKTNAGKSSLLNTLTDQDVAIVSEMRGTTTDPIFKNMEIHDLGAVVFIDTAGIDDKTELGDRRIEKSTDILDRCDAFIYILSSFEEPYLEKIKSKNKPIIYVISKGDTEFSKDLLKFYKDLDPFIFISGDESKKYELVNLIASKFKKIDEKTITGNLVKAFDLVMLVMPQDREAPKGRLITPQVQTIRELLDKNAIISISDVKNFKLAIDGLSKNPDLIITDSVYFKEVHDMKPDGVKMTSFSVLFSAYKGDLSYFVDSVRVLDNKENTKKIMIAESCTHPPIEEDIGRVKIPNMIKKKYGEDIEFSFSRGTDFKDITDVDLIIHCGACMFNRTQTLSRVDKARELGIPMTNYGITIAYLKGILDDVVMPE